MTLPEKSESYIPPTGHFKRSRRRKENIRFGKKTFVLERKHSFWKENIRFGMFKNARERNLSAVAAAAVATAAARSGRGIKTRRRGLPATILREADPRETSEE
jgi:hypothetical protein